MYQIIGTITYFLLTTILTVYVGHRCHKYGYHYILDLFNQNETITKATNNSLLTGYYLLNIGYIVFTISNWQIATNWQQVFEITASRISHIVLILCGLHYINIFTLYIIKHINYDRF